MRNKIRAMIGPMEMIVLVVVLALTGFIAWRTITSEEVVTDITSYDECVAAGYPVMLSFPPRCAVPGGETFTQQLGESVESGEVETFTGVVTEFDLTPTHVDGVAILYVDGKFINTGSGEVLPDAVWGSFDRSLSVGDEVEVKAVKDGESYTLFDCASCYVRKAE